MTIREGSLEAPTRHPIEWRSADYYDEDKTHAEMHRVFEVCHGCRRCVNLCTAFPTLFDLIDEGKTGELDGVDHRDFAKVVDKCYLCDMCYMSKCPYVPPHPWNIDFPHVMLRAKAIKFKKNETRFRDRLLTSTDAVGKLASIPVVVTFVNVQSVLGVHKDRKVPDYSSARFRTTARPDASFPVKDGKNAPGKVAIFSTCYVNYNEPGLGHDLLKVLKHNQVPAIIVEKEACCGMPKLELGDLETVAKLKQRNIPVIAKLAREGYAILTAVPSCTLMFKQELPLLFPDDDDVKAVRDAMFDPFEYLIMRNRDGLLRTDFKKSLGKVSYHIPCHLRVQNMGQKTRELLELVPQTEVNTVERCAGHDGTWGVKAEFFADSMKIGRPVFRQMASTAPDYVSSDCAIAARHIQQGIADSKLVEGPVEKQHPLTLIRLAYGL
jgi:Fe-S oxidoreductase